jgi:hypothetical protein
MNRDRIRAELITLAEICAAVDYDLVDGTVLLQQYPLPDGWNAGTATIWFDLPPAYPTEQPDVYIPEDLRFRGKRPLIMMNRGPDGWSKYCIHKLHDWDPRRHTLVTLTRMIDTSLHNPNSNNPLEQRP